MADTTDTLPNLHERPETPAERRRARVRDLIIDAAERVFVSEGPEGLSIRRLAEEIDYSPAAIYKYFSSKTELVECLQDAFFQRLLERLDLVLDDDTVTPDKKMRRCLHTYIATALEKPHHYAAAFSTIEDEMPGGAETELQFSDAYRGQAYLMLRGQVEKGIAEGRLRNDLPAHTAAKCLWASLHGATLLMIHMPGFPGMFPGEPALSRDAFIEAHADFLVCGLEKREK